MKSRWLSLRGILSFLVVPGLLTGAGTGAAQVPAKVLLALPDARLDVEFSNVSHLIELTGSLILVADGRENTLLGCDLAAGACRQLGRKGSGPGEYRVIGALLPRRGGGAWIGDFLQRRLVPLLSDGTFLDPVRMPVAVQLRGADADGNLYGEALQPRRGIARADSMWILRWNPDGSRVDTLMKYDAGVTKWTAGGGPPFRLPVWPSIDTWMPLPDGSILVLEAQDYRATVWRDGNLQTSRQLDWIRRQVTRADRDSYLKSRAMAPTRLMSGAGTSTRSAPPQVEYVFPEMFPPFGGRGGGGVYTIVAPNGDVWIERLVSPGDSVPVYDVILGGAGVLRGRVELPPRFRVIAVGAGGVYTVVRSDEDIEQVRRHPYPQLQGR